MNEAGPVAVCGASHGAMLEQQTIAIIAVGAALAVLHLRTTGELRADVRELRAQVTDVAQRLARLEGWLQPPATSRRGT